VAAAGRALKKPITRMPESNTQLLPSQAAGDFYGEIATDFGHLEQLQPEWERLWRSTPGHDVFQHFAWLRAWWHTLGRGWSLFTPLIYSPTGLAAILPIIRRGRELRFLGYQGADYNTLLADSGQYPKALKCALELLLKESRFWDTCLLNNISERSLLPACIAPLPSRLHGKLIIEFDSTCPALILGEDKDQVLSALIRKESLRRHRKKLEKLGPVEFRHISDGNEQVLRLPEFMLQHIARRALAGGRSEFLQPEFVAFYEALVRELHPLGLLRFSVLQVQGRAVAYHFGFEAEHKYIWYKPAFDVNLWEAGPGEVLLQSLLSDIRERDVRELDFTWGDEQFKNRFSNVVRNNYLVRFSSASGRGKLAWCAARGRASLKKHERITNFAKRMRDRLRPASLRVRRLWSGEASLRTVLEGLFHRRVYEHRGVHVYSSAAGNSIVPGQGACLKPLSLAQIAGMAHRHPDFLTTSALCSFRERLKRGDAGYAAYQNGELAYVAWTGEREAISLFSDGAGSDELLIQECGIFVYDCWRSKCGDQSGVVAQSLKDLLSIAAARNKVMWICAGSGDSLGRREIEAAGLSLRYRAHSVRILGGKTKQWLERPDGRQP
jgi:CelD/BcsL family acetyltransferase involved in cellulose biosynthesis